MFAMLPIFMLGVIVGVLLTVAYNNYKADTPSEVKLHMKEANIIRLQEDIRLLQEENEKLSKELRKYKL